MIDSTVNHNSINQPLQSNPKHLNLENDRIKLKSNHLLLCLRYISPKTKDSKTCYAHCCVVETGKCRL